MDIYTMKKSDFKMLPKIEDASEITQRITGVVIIPTNRKHDSGYRIIHFVPCSSSTPLGIIECPSDVLHLDGIGGYGLWEDYVPKMIEPKAWSVDCLPCGYMRVFARGELKFPKFIGSDGEVFCLKD